MIPKKCRLLSQAEQDYCKDNCLSMTASEIADELGAKYAHVQYYLKTYCPGYVAQPFKKKDKSGIVLSNSKGFFSPENYLKLTTTI